MTPFSLFFFFKGNEWRGLYTTYITFTFSPSVSLKVYIVLRKRFSPRSCQIWNLQRGSQKFLARSMQTQLSACGNNEHGTFTEKEKQHTNICHFFKQTNGDLRQIFTDRNNCSILPSPNELKNVLSVCAFDSLQRNEVTYSFPNK